MKMSMLRAVMIRHIHRTTPVQIPNYLRAMRAATNSLQKILVSLMQGGCGAGASLLDRESTPGREHLDTLDAVETRVVRLLASMEAAPAAASDRPGRHPCHGRVSGDPRSAMAAMPAECAVYRTQQETRDALRTVQLALARDLAAMVARMRRLSRNRHYGEDQWRTMVALAPMPIS